MTDDLTAKRELFCQTYVELFAAAGDSASASEAYRRSYDASGMAAKTVWEEASRLMADSKVSARIAELKAAHLARHNVTVDRVLKEYARLAFLDIRRAFDESGNLKPVHELDDDTAAAVAGLEVEVRRAAGEAHEELEGQPHGGALRRQHGATARLHKVKLSDKKGALDSLAKYLGLFSDAAQVVVNPPLTADDRSLLEAYAGRTPD